jgi:cysteinyl-tRNA synthetase
MTLSIYNTLTRRQAPFTPLEPGRVRMYVCGVTVYDLCHIGHGRTFVAFDVVVRWLRASGYKVTFVRNVTDVDDKIIKRAAERGVTTTALTEEYTRAMQLDLAALGCVAPDVEPRATAFIPQMLGLIDLLEQNDLAYRADDGDVNFAVRRFPGYGKLSGKSLDDLRAGQRVAVGDSKRDPLDFVLWKHAKPGEPQWTSKWGPGRPGWHIECSAMSGELLGHSFDIHGGGPDLIFPHHENEIAQSEGGFRQPFAAVWMHSGALRVGEDKMSKSLGNFLTIRDALGKYDAEALRFFLVRSHYRSQFSFTEDMIAEAKTALTRLYTALRDTLPAAGEVDWTEPAAQRFKAAMNDDFNTAGAAAVLFDLAGEVNRTRSHEAARQLKGLAGILGFLQRDPNEFLRGGSSGDDARIEEQIAERAAAKKTRNFAEADRIRSELAAQGIVLEDSAGGTTWRRQ